MDGTGGVYLHLAAEGAFDRAARADRNDRDLREGEGIVVRHDRRPQIGDVLNALLRSPVVTARNWRTHSG